MCDIKKVSNEELVKILIDYNRCTPVVIETVTDVSMNKKKKFVLDDNEYIVTETKPKVDRKTKEVVLNESGEPVMTNVYESLAEENPYLGATCRKFTNGVINFDYENSVNRQKIREDKEADFEVAERKWGKHVTRAVIEHKEKYYLQIKVNKTYGQEYSLGNELVEYNSLKPFITPKQSVGRQGVEDDVIINDVKIDESLKSITIDKVKYVVE